MWLPSKHSADVMIWYVNVCIRWAEYPVRLKHERQDKRGLNSGHSLNAFPMAVEPLASYAPPPPHTHLPSLWCYSPQTFCNLFVPVWLGISTPYNHVIIVMHNIVLSTLWCFFSQHNHVPCRMNAISSFTEGFALATHSYRSKVPSSILSRSSLFIGYL